MVKCWSWPLKTRCWHVNYGSPPPKPVKLDSTEIHQFRRFLKLSNIFLPRYCGFQRLTQLDRMEIHQIWQKFIRPVWVLRIIWQKFLQIWPDLCQIWRDLIGSWMDPARSHHFLVIFSFTWNRPPPNANPNRPIQYPNGLVVGLEIPYLIWSGQLWVKHKLSLNQPMDNPVPIIIYYYDAVQLSVYHLTKM